MGGGVSVGISVPCMEGCPSSHSQLQKHVVSPNIGLLCISRLDYRP
jgi:hypothetical protein